MTAPTPDVGRVLVDPRFRQRRIAVRREAGRRRLRRLVLLVAVAAVALATVIVLRSPVLDVDGVAVAGARYTSAAAIEEATGIGVGSPLLLADVDGAEDALESLPWVEEATVTRDLPSRVVVELDERVPAARVAFGSDQLLVDGRGRVLAAGDPSTYPERVPRQPAFIPVIVPDRPATPAPGSSVDRSLLDAIGLAGRLRENPAGAVTAVRLEPTLRLDLAGGGHADLGDATDLDAKVEAFRTAFARIDLTCASRLDLRVPTHPVLTRRAGCS
jgi:cell division protein FtsQ